MVVGARGVSDVLSGANRRRTRCSGEAKAVVVALSTMAATVSEITAVAIGPRSGRGVFDLIRNDGGVSGAVEVVEMSGIADAVDDRATVAVEEPISSKPSAIS